MTEVKYIPVAIDGISRMEDCVYRRVVFDFAGVNPDEIPILIRQIASARTISEKSVVLANLPKDRVRDVIKDLSDGVDMSPSGQWPFDGSIALDRVATYGLLLERKSYSIPAQSGIVEELARECETYVLRMLNEITSARHDDPRKHFVTPGGAHTPQWYYVAPVLQKRGATAYFAAHLTRRLVDIRIDAVLPWATTGLQIAARLRTQGQQPRVVLANRDEVTTNLPVIAPSFEKDVRGKRVLLLVDVLCAGDTIAKLAELVQRFDGTVAAVAGIVRFKKSSFLDEVLHRVHAGNKLVPTQLMPQIHEFKNVPEVWLARVDVDLHSEKECRSCKHGILRIDPFGTEANTGGDGADGVESVSGGPYTEPTPISWQRFWSEAHRVDAIGRVEEQVRCTHDHDGQVVDISALVKCESLWLDIVDWADAEIKKIHDSVKSDIWLLVSKSNAAKLLASDLRERGNSYIYGPIVCVQGEDVGQTQGQIGAVPKSGSHCIVLDDSIFTTRTVRGMLAFAERSGAKCLAILTIMYCAAPDEDWDLQKRIGADIQVRAAYTSRLRWSDDRSSCEAHRRFDRVCKLNGHGNWSDYLRQWFNSNIVNIAKPTNQWSQDIQVTCLFRMRPSQIAVSGRGVTHVSVDDFSKFVADWRGTSGTMTLGPDFCIPMVDIGSRLSEQNAKNLIMSLLDSSRLDRGATDGLSDLLSSLPRSLCHGLHGYFLQAFRDYTTDGSQIVDAAYIALFKVLWDLNIDRDARLFDALISLGTDSDPHYGSLLCTVFSTLRRSADISPVISSLTTKLNEQAKVRDNSFVRYAISDLQEYSKILSREETRKLGYVAIFTSSDRHVKTMSESRLTEIIINKERSVEVDFVRKEIRVEGKVVPTRSRANSKGATKLRVVALICMSPYTIKTGNVVDFLKRGWPSEYDPWSLSDIPNLDLSSTARKMLASIRNDMALCNAIGFEKANGGEIDERKKPWLYRVKNGWNYIIVDTEPQPNLAYLLRYIENHFDQ